MSAETYDGPHDYESLSAFAKENVVKTSCSIYQMQNCSPEQITLIQSLEAKSTEELEATVALVEAQVAVKENEFDEKVQVVQRQYDVLVEAFNKELFTIKNAHNYKYVEQILNARTEGAEHEDGGEL